ncbi:MAG: phospholipid carrier-dependent glycosyltransferase [Planctomycetota bacterium]|nr:MAG: phospholipid carrier-dependent glycosyltransferase [Planctomycetota bacterium]
MEFKKEFYSSLAVWLFIILLSFGLYFQNLRARDFWEPDEPRFAEVVREMQFRQDYLFPTVNLQPYPNKPPLYYWMAALFSRDQVNEVSARLPSALAGLGGLMVIYLLGTLLFHRGVGFIAALALAVNGRYLWQSQYVQMDMMLAFLCYFLSICFFWVGKKNGNSPF